MFSLGPGTLSTDGPPEWKVTRWCLFLDEGKTMLCVGRPTGVSLRFLPFAYGLSSRRVLIMGSPGYQRCHSIVLSPDMKVEVAGDDIVIDRTTSSSVYVRCKLLDITLLVRPVHVTADLKEFAGEDFIFQDPSFPKAVANLIRATDQHCR
jgi:hypothetical protein